jgi:hypothetical protein
LQHKALTFFGRLRIHVQSEREPILRDATLYLLLHNEALVRAASDFAQGNVTSEQLTDAVSSALERTVRKYAVTASDVSALLEKHSVAAFSKY